MESPKKKLQTTDNKKICGTMNSCILCLNVTFQKNSISTSDVQDCGTTIESIIKEHFWFSNQINEDRSPDKPKITCKTCWSKLENFHEFYCAVKQNYNINDDTGNHQNAIDEISAENTKKVDFEKCEEIDEDDQETVVEVHLESPEHILKIEKLTVQEAVAPRSLRKRFATDQLRVAKLSKPVLEPELKHARRTKFTKEEEDIMKANAEMKCEVCLEELTSWMDAKSHYSQHHKQDHKQGFIRCCERKIFLAADMIDHIMWHQDRNIFTCMTCGKVLLTRENLATHEATHIPEELRQYQCPSCPKKVASPFALTLHKATHKKDNLLATIPCTLCPDKKFKTMKQLKLHTSNCHESNGPFMCELCSRVLKTQCAFKNHMKDHTDPDPPMQCTICSHVLKNRRRFAIHMSKHKQAETGPWQCPHCERKCPHKHALQAHIAYVHTSKRFSCDQCGKVFKQKKALEEHQAQHTGLDKYQCPFCSRSFKSSGNMHSHKKKMHPEDYAQLPLANHLLPIEVHASQSDEQ